MFLVGAPDFTSVNVSILGAWIHGYDLALEDVGRDSEHEHFVSWLHARRPDLQNHPLWYGEALLPSMGNDHERVVAQILEWVHEFEKNDQTDG